ncbi:MAG TPA: dihydrolipoamide acetyltransferase family protein [Woeseiaceae bacterium]|nr:dihydrolipoamide acetyltransferase family protein [Woeseiaceae bacterium]
MTTFNLPDLGEGLPEAEIVAWHVAEGDTVRADDLLVSVETAKAVVEVPSPYSGVVERLRAKPGDIVETGAPLIDFAGAAGAAKPPQGTETAAGPAAKAPEEAPREDAGSVVGSVQTGADVLEETAIPGGRRRRGKGRVKAAPAVRAQAKRLGIDLAEVEPTGRNGQVTTADLEAHQARGKKAAAVPAARPAAPRPPTAGESRPMRGPRRAMAQSMSVARDQVALCTTFDDADINDWVDKRDFTPRILRALVAGCEAEAGLNGFFDPETMTQQVEPRVDVAIAVDTEQGLIVPVIRNVERMGLDEIRAAVARLKEATRNRTVAPEEMLNYTITVSNFGMLAGRYATPIMVPPTVAILGTGKLQHDVVAVMGGIEVHRRIPLSLSFDHRCITGGEACRFLAAVIADLEKPQ